MSVDFSGPPRRRALDLLQAGEAMRLLGVKRRDRRRVTEGLRTMEIAALEALYAAQ